MEYIKEEDINIKVEEGDYTPNNEKEDYLQTIKNNFKCIKSSNNTSIWNRDFYERKTNELSNKKKYNGLTNYEQLMLNYYNLNYLIRRNILLIRSHCDEIIYCNSITDHIIKLNKDIFHYLIENENFKYQIESIKNEILLNNPSFLENEFK